MNRLVRALASGPPLSACLIAGVVVFAACSMSDLDGSELCKQAGYAIANRTFVCTGDQDLANERYERFRDESVCTASGEVKTYSAESGFGCSSTILKYDCARVDAMGDDLSAWLEGCYQVYIPEAGVSNVPEAGIADAQGEEQ